MFINRYTTKTGPENVSDVNHFNKFFKKIRKRQQKKQGLDANLSTKKTKLDVNERDNTKNIGLNLQKDLFVKNSLLESAGGSTENFTIIGDHSFSKNNKVKAILPRWLSHPELIQTDLTKISCPIPDLNSKLMLNLNENNITNFFPVQQAVIPWIMKQTHRTSLSTCNYTSRDICVSSPTGSGKTLAYVLPIVQGLINRLVPRIRCLVVVPVQELAEQVANVFRSYSKGTSLRVVSVTGGKAPLQVEQEWLLKKIKGVEDTYESLVDIVVTTPGRLVEHLQKTEGFNLRNLKYLVIDEADRVIDGIQNDWLFYLEKHLGQEIFPSLSLNYLRKRRTLFQKLLFSATLSQDTEKLKKLNLFQPILFTSTDKNKGASEVDGKEEGTEYVGKFTMPRELEEYYTVVESYFKPIVIAELLSGYRWRRVLCFCKSAAEANRLSKLISFLCPTLKIADISSLLQRTARNLVLQQFSKGEIDMLVSSDVMARGIDIPQVHYVISYDPPKYLRGYVHRAGRTGRAGMKGTVLTLTTPSQIVPFTQKLKEANRINVNELKMDAKIFEDRATRFKKALKKLKLQSEESEEKVIYLKKSRELKRKKRKIKFRSSKS